MRVQVSPGGPIKKKQIKMKTIKSFIGEIAAIIVMINVLHINVWKELKVEWKRRYARP